MILELCKILEKLDFFHKKKYDNFIVVIEKIKFFTFSTVIIIKIKKERRNINEINNKKRFIINCT